MAVCAEQGDISVTLVVFDMDGTLLNASSEVTPFTAETLARLRSAGIAYTVATGRTLQAALGPLRSFHFELPHILKNGAMIWCPNQQNYSHSHLLTQHEVYHVLAAMTLQEITPFVFTLEGGSHHAVYHGPLKNEAENRLAQLFEDERHLPLEAISAMPDTAHVINVSGMGPRAHIETVIDSIADEARLVAYTGTAIQSEGLSWMDIHHSSGSKGNGINTLRRDHGYDRVVVFGDGDNDLSMFAVADEAYATANADDEVKAEATAVIGHHNEDGVAHFLWERFGL